MSTTKKTAGSRSAEPAARRRALLAGALLGWALALLAGTLLSGELQAVRALFLPLSALAGGVAGLGAWVHLAALTDERLRSRRLRQGLTVLAAGLALLVVLYQAFVVRVPYEGGAKSVAYVKGWSRSGLCDCSADDALCIQEMGLDPSRFGGCWNGRSTVQSALALGYLVALAGLGAFGGVLAGRRPLRGPGAPPGYLDFDVWIDRQDGGYRAKAWSGAAGFEATRRFTLSPALERAGPCSFATGDPSRGGADADAEADGPGPQEIGGALFDAIFQGELLKAFQGCLAKSEAGLGLRLRLRLNDVPHLAQLPWEYLYQEGGRGFLALSPRTPVVRYLELSEALDELRVAPPLRVLAVISTPREYRELDEADVEWERLQGALAPLLAAGQLEVERLAQPTRAALAARLADRGGAAVHVLHFVGHGGYSELRGEGVLVFEGEDGDGVPVGAQSLAYLAQDHPSLRLAVLNACNGARGAADDAFAGTAQALVRHGVPAVIAMQAEVTDGTACLFAERFYRGLAGGLPVDACMGEVRRALAAEGNPEWGTPVLYLRATDGRLFEVAEAAGE
jgi:hypothetical protein